MTTFIHFAIKNLFRALRTHCIRRELKAYVIVDHVIVEKDLSF